MKTSQSGRRYRANVQGNPPIFQGSGYQAVEVLGKLLNYDLNMSPFKNRACAFCHMPYAGFSGPIPSVNLAIVAYPGSAQYGAAKRTAMRYTYAPNFPVMNYNTEQGLFFARKSLGWTVDRLLATKSQRRAGTETPS